MYIAKMQKHLCFNCHVSPKTFFLTNVMCYTSVIQIKAFCAKIVLNSCKAVGIIFYKAYSFFL